ncbi:MAG: DUF1080 domain-containing protein [Gammaproteobacteria bacterium]|nr:DUF1080 domain-containing protein [Gammaproteobacteria bacterium]
MSFNRRIGVAVIAWLVAGCGGNTRPEERPLPDPTRQWISLFDGRTLDGWTTKIVGYPAGEDPLQTFRARDGAIYVSYDKYGGRLASRFAHLFYRMPFKAYRLSMEYRFIGDVETMNDPPKRKPFNSGVLYYSESPQRMPLNQPFPISVEAQLLASIPGSDHVRYTGSACGMGTLVSAAGGAPVECIDSQYPERPAGEWVLFELEVRPDGHVTQSINGTRVAAFDQVHLDTADARFPSQELIDAQHGNPILTSGYIALQSEGHPIEFRHIRLQPLE